jgi:NO-binding membrane sensor protein with MHYT domain
VEEQFTLFTLFTLTLDGNEWSTSLCGHFAMGAAISGMHWVGLEADLGNLERDLLSLYGILI